MKKPHHNTKHGMDGTPTYRTWVGMRRRCHNPNTTGYERYGGRGIKVCDRWENHDGHGFERFLEDMGPRPEGKSLDRIDNDGDYTPENCRWADRYQQARNDSRNVRVKANGETLCISEWAERLGTTPDVICARINKHGWEPERAVTQPVRPHSRIIRARGKAMTIKEWAEEIGCDPAVISGRLHAGCSPERAVSTADDLRAHYITAHGETLRLHEWADRLGCANSVIRHRLESGWSEEDAVTKPVRGSKISSRK